MSLTSRINSTTAVNKTKDKLNHFNMKYSFQSHSAQAGLLDICTWLRHFSSAKLKPVAQAFLLLLSVMILPACFCVTVPPADKYFNRSTPASTVNMFRYAIETEQYKFAYDCMTEESKKTLNLTSFKWAVKLGAVPQWNDLGFTEFITNCAPYPHLDRTAKHFPNEYAVNEYGLTLAYRDEEDNVYDQVFKLRNIRYDNDPEQNRKNGELWLIDLHDIKGLTP